MYPASKLRVRLLGTTNLNESYQHSILISALRACAALQVLAAHLRGELFPSLRTVRDPSLWYEALAFFTGFSHLAVVVFFVLSGWLVGGSLLNKLGEPQILASYAIDRLTRMWIVLIPAFLLTLVLAAMTETVDPHRVSYAVSNEYSMTSFLGNLVGLQGMAVQRYGGNFALWSLSNEMWYYALFPSLLLLFTGKSLATKTAGLLAAVAIASLLLTDIVVYFVIWVLGVAFSRIQIDLPRRMRFLLVGLVLGLAVYFRLAGSNGTLIAASFTDDLLFSLAFLCLLSSLQFPAERASPGNRIMILAGLLAPFSFTLYVIHYPLILMLKGLDGPLRVGHQSTSDPGSLLVYGALFLGIVGFAYLFHIPFEAQTYRLRRFVKRLLLEPAADRYSRQG